MAERAAAAAAPDGIELVDEDDAGLVAAGFLEQPAHARGADAGEHLDKVGAAREEERDARFAGYGPRQQRLARAWRADQKDAFWNPSAERREAVGLTEEVDDLLHLVLGFVDTGDILEGHDVVAALGDPRPT